VVPQVVQSGVAAARVDQPDGATQPGESSRDSGVGEPAAGATVPKGAAWPAALTQLATALDTGRVYDRDLPALAQALADVADALDRRPGWRLRTR